MDPKINQNPLNTLCQPDNPLQAVSKQIAKGLTDLYEHLDTLKQTAMTQKQLQQLTHVQYKIDSLATKTLAQSQDLKNCMKRSNVEWEIENLKQQLDLLERRHQELVEKHGELEKRVNQMECTMVTREELEDLRGICQERFCLFEDRFKVVQQQNQKLFLYIDEEFKRRIKPTQTLKQKLSELSKSNPRMFQYAKKMYWSLMNQILAYRTLSSGLVQKTSTKDKYQQSTLFKQVVAIVSSATYLIAGVPFVGGVFLAVKELASIFFRKNQEAVLNNMCVRVEGYYAEDQIAEDVATAVLELINNPHIETRLNQFKTRSMAIDALCKFFQFISTTEISPQLLADLFASKLTKIKKQKQSPSNDFIIENVATDTSLIIWKIAEIPPVDRRFAVTCAVRAIFRKDGDYGGNKMCISAGNTSGNVSSDGRNNCMTLSSGPTLQRNFIIDPNDPPQEIVFKPSIQNQPPIYQQSTPQFKPSVTQSEISTTPSSSQLNQQNKAPTSTPTPTNNTKYFKLKILRATLPQKKTFLSRLNPYCTIKYRTQYLQTQSQKIPSLQASWNQQFILSRLKSDSPSTISIQVYNRQKFLKDQLLGLASLTDVVVSQKEQEVELWNQGRVVGKVWVCLEQ